MKTPEKKARWESMFQQSLELAQQMIRAPSSVTEAHGKWPEEGVANVIRSYADRCRLEIQTIPADGERTNLLIRYPYVESGATARLLLAGHMDTVAAGNCRNAFVPAIHDDRLYGRGACDMKGPLAMGLAVLGQLAKERIPLSSEVCLACTIDEEVRMLGAKTLAQRLSRFDGVLVLEPTMLSIVHAHKGVFRFQLTTSGKSAHSSCPDRGENAILKTLCAAQKLNRFGGEKAVEQHPILGKRTLAITEISGGTQRNIIPDSCRLGVDIRTLPEDNPRRLENELRQLLADDDGVSVDFAVSGMDTPVDTPLVLALTQAVNRSGLRPQMSGVSYCTDSAYLQALGPCVVWGPGDITQAHGDDEFIELSQLRQACKVLEALLYDTKR